MEDLVSEFKAVLASSEKLFEKYNGGTKQI
jgi:hypothetical protein